MTVKSSDTGEVLQNEGERAVADKKMAVKASDTGEVVQNEGERAVADKKMAVKASDIRERVVSIDKVVNPIVSYWLNIER